MVVWKKGNALIPGWAAFAVVNLMEKHFTGLVDYKFTAKMEDDLDEIASGAQQKVPYLKQFYWGEKKKGGLHAQVSNNLDKIIATTPPRDQLDHHPARTLRRQRVLVT